MTSEALIEGALLASNGQLVTLVFVFYIVTKSKKERFSLTVNFVDFVDFHIL